MGRLNVANYSRKVCYCGIIVHILKTPGILRTTTQGTQPFNQRNVGTDSVDSGQLCGDSGLLPRRLPATSRQRYWLAHRIGMGNDIARIFQAYTRSSTNDPGSEDLPGLKSATFLRTHAKYTWGPPPLV